MLRLRVLLTPALILFAAAACKAINDTPLSGKKITNVRFAASERMPCTPCDMILTVDDTIEFHVRETTGVSKLAPDSSWVAFTSFGGSGGYRGSGQALWRYDIKSAQKTEIMREYYLVEQLEMVRPKGGPPLLIVSMREPMTLVRHVGIVDPMRGEVFRAESSVITATDSTGFTVSEWGAPVSWQADALTDSTGLPRMAPIRTRRFSYAELGQLAVVKNDERVWGQQLEFEATRDTFDYEGAAPVYNNAQPTAPIQNQPGGLGSKSGPGGQKAGQPAQPGQGVRVRIP